MNGGKKRKALFMIVLTVAQLFRECCVCEDEIDLDC